MRRPVWEDPLNRAGGKWIIRLRKGVADRVWEDLVCGVVGDLFDECARGRPNVNGDENANEDENGEEWPEICGCTISVRQSEDIVSVWNRVEADIKVREKIRWVARPLHMGTLIMCDDPSKKGYNTFGPQFTCLYDNGVQIKQRYLDSYLPFSYVVNVACLMQTRYKTSPHFVTLPLNARLPFPDGCQAVGWVFV